MYAVPENWENLMARFRFFDALPRPLAVLIVCDLAALAPQDETGRRAIDAVREWLLGQYRDEDLAALFHNAFAGATGQKLTPTSGGRFAAGCAVGVAAAQRDSAVSAIMAAEALAKCGAENATFERQRRVAAQIIQVAANETVRHLLRAAETDLSARAVFWDAMHDAGYIPIATQPE